MPETLPAFESETCSRCWGTGNYSYCQSYGTRCFKCHGKKKVLTKRGRVAYERYAETLKVPVLSLKIGESFRSEGVPGFTPSFWAKVIEISERKELGKSKSGNETEWTVHFGIEVTGEHERHGLAHVSQDEKAEPRMVRKAWTWEYKKARWLEAIEFQKTLKANGEPYKRLPKEKENA